MASEETVIFSTFLTALVVLTIFVSVSALSILRHQRRKREWLRSLALSDIVLLEEERRRISADLHDDFGSVLAAVSRGLDLLHERYPDDTSVARTKEHIQVSFERLRQITNNLVPRVLEMLGLMAAVGGLADEVGQLTGITVHVSGECHDHDFDPGRALLLYRIIQEVVSNSIKHAGAANIYIHLHEYGNKLFLDLADDGCGFDYEETIATSGSFGLRNIRSRLTVLRALCAVESSNGKGTRYAITIPLNQLKKINTDKPKTN